MFPNNTLNGSNNKLGIDLKSLLRQYFESEEFMKPFHESFMNDMFKKLDERIETIETETVLNNDQNQPSYSDFTGNNKYGIELKCLLRQHFESEEFMEALHESFMNDMFNKLDECIETQTVSTNDQNPPSYSQIFDGFTAMFHHQSQTFNQVEYGPCGHNGPTNIPLSHGLNQGTVLGITAATHNRSSFNIKDVYGNILLHFNPRIDQNVVVLNNQCGSWGPEERPGNMPIRAGVKYCVHIAYEAEGFRIFINGEEFAFFRHRSSNSAAMLELSDAQLYKIRYERGAPRWAIFNSMNSMYVQDYGTCGVSTPHQMQLTQSGNCLSWAVVTGIVNNNANRFAINLYNADGNILLHFNPRFNDNCVVRNTLKYGSWGQEERHGGLPIQRGQKFVVAIVVEETCYRMYVNGEEFGIYNHRLPFNTINRIEVAEELKVLKIACKK